MYPAKLQSILVLAALLSGTVAAAAHPMRMCNRPALSPDGELLVVEWCGDLWIGSSNGGEMQRRTASPAIDTRPIISPDGRHIAFQSDRCGSQQVYLMPIEGGPVEQVTFHSEGSTLEDWSRDGATLLLSGKRDHFWTRSDRLFLLDLHGDRRERLVVNAYATSGRFAHDTKHLYFTRLGVPWWRQRYRGSRVSQIWQAGGPADSLLAVVQAEYSAHSPLWDAKREALLYVADAEGAFNLWRRDSDGTTTKLTHFEQGVLVDPCISGNGEVVVFRHQFDLYRLDLSQPDHPPKKLHLVGRSDADPNGIVRNVLDECSEVAFTSDGLQIALIAGGDLWVMDTTLREPQRVTDTPGPESSPRFSPDDKQLAFISEQKGQPDIWVATHDATESYWWQTRQFHLQQLTNDARSEKQLKWSPAGDRLAFCTASGELVVKNLTTAAETILHTGWDVPQFDWAPDGKWLCYSTRDDNYNADVYLVPADGGADAVNISTHPRNDEAPVWSPNGESIAYISQREADEVDIVVVDLAPQPRPKSERLAQLREALELMKEKHDDDAKTTNSGAGADDQASGAASDAAPEALANFAEVASWDDRSNRLDIPGIKESQLIWSHDSSRLAFTGRSNGDRNTYIIGVTDNNQPERWSSTTGVPAAWREDGSLAWLSDGVPGVLSEDGEKKRYAFTCYQKYCQSAYFAAVLSHCWRLVNDTFYDADFHGVDWRRIREAYLPMAADAKDRRMLADIIRMMLGELNASHQRLNVNSRSNRQAWTEETHHLGCWFAAADEKPGLEIRHVAQNASAAGLAVGDRITAINGVRLQHAAQLPELLTGPPNMRAHVDWLSADGEVRKATLIPISYASARDGLYDRWVGEQAELVDELSDHRFGYVHVRSMGSDNLAQFERDMFDAGKGKDALVIDVRFNGGGRIADHLLSMLAHPHHALTTPRGGGPGYPHDRRTYATWSRPIVVLANEFTASNAEIFCHAIKTIGRGAVVGTPSAGYVVTANTIDVMDFGEMRITQRGWRVATTDRSMEGAGVMPDLLVPAAPGDIPEGRDPQLEAAIRHLQRTVASTTGGNRDD